MRLLEVVPELGARLSPQDFAAALEQVVMLALTLDQGPLVPDELRRPPGVRGDVLGFVVITGALTMELEMGGRSCARLVGPGELVLIDGGDNSSVPMRWSWAVLESPSEIVVLDDGLLAAGRRWPRLVAGALEAGAAQVAHAFLQQAISQLPRVEDRLLALFWSMADRHGVVRPDGVWVGLSATHDLLGRMIGAQRPTVSLGLRSLAERGLLRPDGAGWLIDRASLDAFPAPGEADPNGQQPPDRSPPANPGEAATISMPSAGRPSGLPRILFISSASPPEIGGREMIAATGEPAALAALDRWRPEVVLVDLDTPAGIVGEALITRLHTDPALAHVRLVLHGSRAARAALAPRLAAAAHDYIARPVTETDLGFRLDAQLALAAAALHLTDPAPTAESALGDAG